MIPLKDSRRRRYDGHLKNVNGTCYLGKTVASNESKIFLSRFQKKAESVGQWETK